MNADELFTRCPTCKTVFRTDEGQLSVQSGRVRCGQCRMVFDGRAHRVDVVIERDDLNDHAAEVERLLPLIRSAPETRSSAAASEPETSPAETRVAGERDGVREGTAGSAADIEPDREHLGRVDPALVDPALIDSALIDPVLINPGHVDPDHDVSERSDPPRASPFPAISIDPLEIGMGPATLARGPSTITGPATVTRAAAAAPAPSAPAWSPFPTAAEGRMPDTISPSPLSQPSVIGESRDKADHVVMPDWKGPVTPVRGGARWGYGLLAALLLTVLAAQSVYHFRNLIAADFPLTRPHLVAACAALGCKIEPLHNRDELAIESHDLQADPAHQGLLIMQTTLRNQARHALAFPHLELELVDDAGKPIVRRVFAPVEYAGGAADFSRGIPANAEWNVKLFLDGSSISAGSYHLYHFYP